MQEGLGAEGMEMFAEFSSSETIGPAMFHLGDGWVRTDKGGQWWDIPVFRLVLMMAGTEEMIPPG